MLKVSHIDVFYGDVQVLWDIFLEVKEREILVLVGANGAGKSTTLRTISGLQRPSRGSIELDGISLHQIPDHKTIEFGIVLVPEGRRLFPEMTVEENLVMGSLMHKARPKRKENLQKVYSFFPLLEQKRRQYARTLSGGEQQLCAVGRGLMSIPRLLMFDEPSLGLAPLLVQEIFRIVQRIDQEGVTVLLVEQNVKQTLNICNHAYVLENGRIVLGGLGKELLNNDYVKQAYLGM